MSIKLKITIKIMAFIVIFIIISLLLTQIFKVKIKTGDFRTTSTVVNFYEEPKDSLDVIFFGTSYVAKGVSPLIIWSEYGIPSYSLAFGQQQAIISYYFLKEAIKRHNPKVIVLGSSAFYKDVNYDETSYNLRKSLNFMPMSLVKIQAISEIVENSDDQEYLDYLFPLAYYHYRWESLEPQDLAPLADEFSFKGISVSYGIKPFVFPDNFMQPIGRNVKINEKNESYIIRMIELCKQENIELVLISIPRLNWNIEKSQEIKRFATNYNLPFIDYNLPENLEAISFDANTDSFDAGGHLNVFGAEKISLHLGTFLAETYNLADERTNEKYEDWAKDLEYYNEEKTAHENDGVSLH